MNILYGICGIGRGHAMRQLPILEALHARGHRIGIFAYADSLTALTPWAKQHNASIHEVAVPFVVGTPTGIDLLATQRHPANQRDFITPNIRAKQALASTLGTPQLVITDYEPTAAEVAYAHNIPLITIDQQSKFLLTPNNLPAQLGGFTCADETARLLHFFPTATHRLACSFFKVESPSTAVTLIPPTLRCSLASLRRTPSAQPSIVVYVTDTNGSLDLPTILQSLGAFPHIRFQLFTKHSTGALPPHITAYQPNETTFTAALATAHGIIASAGHSLISEAMFLGLPVLAVPTAIYEQHLNAHILHTHKLGASTPILTPQTILHFIDNLSTYAKNIQSSPVLLTQTNGTHTALSYLK